MIELRELLIIGLICLIIIIFLYYMILIFLMIIEGIKDNRKHKALNISDEKKYWSLSDKADEDYDKWLKENENKVFIGGKK